jgi:hypothetical protein
MENEMSKELNINNDYSDLLSQIATLYKQGQHNATIAINTALVETYWQIGKYIVDFEQKGKQKAEYGTALIDNLSKDLSLSFGKGFSRSNLVYIRLFYSEFQISETPSHLLSWSHYVELLKIQDKLERSFYLQQTINEKWSIRELKRQKKSSLFLRLAASKDKEGILALAKQGQLVEKPTDILREPYVLDFLKIPEPYHLNRNRTRKNALLKTIAESNNFIVYWINSPSILR